MDFQTIDDVVLEAVDFTFEEPLNLSVRPDEKDVPDIDMKLSWLPANDYGNAQRLLARGGRDLCWIADAGWLGWDGKKWSLEEGDGLAVRRAHETIKAMRGEVAALLARGPFDGEKNEDFIKRINKYHTFRIKSGDLPRVRGMLDSAATYLKQRIENMDADPYLFTVENGTIKLNTPETDDCRDVVSLIDHDRSNFATKMGGVVYDPDALCPNFHAFLNDILPDASIQKFLQVWFGYSLSGLLREQYVVMFHGGGSNGKSTLMDLLNGIFGDYAMTIPFASLLKDDKKRGAEATPDLARLPGARFVTAAEPEQGAQFSESTIKQLTGSEKITARHLNKGFFEFYPQFKLVLSFNTKPQIRGQDEGIWRRVKLVPFDQKFVSPEKLAENPGAKLKDPSLMPRLKAEASGVLNWVLDGWRIYCEEGLVIPEIVNAATQEYRQESNPVGEFISNWTMRRPGERILASRLYRAYQEYCKKEGMKAWTQKTFGDRLTEQGVRREKISGYTQYLDLVLTHEAEKEVDGGNSMPDYNDHD